MRKLFLSSCLLIMHVGCGGDGLMNATGTVHYADGSVPKGEVAMVRFTPTRDSPSPSRRAVEGTINPEDGSFELMTYRPGDGIHAGDYIVSFTVREKYLDPTSAIPEEYTEYGSHKTSPLKVTVDSGNRHFDFQLEP